MRSFLNLVYCSFNASHTGILWASSCVPPGELLNPWTLATLKSLELRTKLINSQKYRYLHFVLNKILRGSSQHLKLVQEKEYLN